jgi:hypothetical protein
VSIFFGGAVEDLQKQIKNLTEIVTKQEKPSASASASSQSEIDVLKAQVETLTDLVLSRNDNKKPAPPPKNILFGSPVMNLAMISCSGF